MATIAKTDNWRTIQARSKAVLPEDVVKFIAQVQKEGHPESQLIAVLHKVQAHYGFLSQERLEAVAQLLGVPAAKVSGVATFYHFFRLLPRGAHMINVCLGTACYVKGASEIAARFKQELDIDFGQTSKDGLFSLEATRCLGTCGLAPVVMIDNEVFPKVTPDQVPSLLEKYRK